MRQAGQYAAGERSVGTAAPHAGWKIRLARRLFGAVDKALELRLWGILLAEGICVGRPSQLVTTMGDIS